MIDSSSNSKQEIENEPPKEVEVESKKTKGVYTIQQKRRIVAYAKEQSIADAYDYFSVPQTTINRWMVDGYFQRETTKRDNKKGAGRHITYGVGIDEESLSWLLDAHDKQLPVTTQLLRVKALELITPTHSEFKASDVWVHQFRHCHSLVLCVKTSLAQELPVTLEERITASCSQLQRLQEINHFEIVGNMDETPLYFDVIPSHILDQKGKKSIIVWTTRSEK